MVGVRKLTQGLKPGFLCLDFSARLKSCPDTRQKQVLRVAYPNTVGAPSCCAQDDTSIGNAEMTRGPLSGLPEPCRFNAAIFRMS
jgi:hypothetical protein